MRTKAGILVGSGDQSHKYGIPLLPTLSPSMLAGPENMEGRSPCCENNIPLISRVFGPYCKLRTLTRILFLGKVTIQFLQQLRSH